MQPQATIPGRTRRAIAGFPSPDRSRALEAVAARPRMLVLDDEEAVRFALRDFFEGHGFAVDCARELEEAEALLAHVPYAVVVADLRLGGIQRAEGLALAASVRERCAGTAVVLLTAHGSPEVEAEARRLGVDRVLHKPEPLPSLARVVRGLLGARP